MPIERKKELEATREKLLDDKDYYHALSCIAIDIANIANSCRENPGYLIEHKDLLSKAIDRFNNTEKTSATIEDVYNPGNHTDSYKGGYKKKINGKYPEMEKLLGNWWTNQKDDIIGEMNFEEMYKEARKLDKDATQMEVHIDKLLSETLQNWCI